MLYCVICLIYCRIAHVKVVIFSRCLKYFDLLGTIILMMHNIFIYSAKEIHPYDRECNYESLLCTVVCQFTHWKVVFHQSIFLYIYIYMYVSRLWWKPVRIEIYWVHVKAYSLAIWTHNVDIFAIKTQLLLLALLLWSDSSVK